MARRVHGLTLLEFLVGVAVLCILLAIGLPAFAATLERLRATTVYHSITTSMAFARTASVTRGRPVVVCPSADGSACRTDGVWEDGWIVFVESARNAPPAEASDVLERSGPLPRGAHVHATDGRRLVRFRPDGSASGTNVTLRLCMDARLFGSVVVNNPGRARTQREKHRPACPFALD